MRIYSKLYLRDDWREVSERDVFPATGTLIALAAPRTKGARVQAYNILARPFDGPGAVWVLQDGSGNTIETFNPVQLANDVFTFVNWNLRHTFDGRPRK